MQQKKLHVYTKTYVKEHGQFGFAAGKISGCAVLNGPGNECLTVLLRTLMSLIVSGKVVEGRNYPECVCLCLGGKGLGGLNESSASDV